MRPDIYFQVHSWMIHKMKLKGLELLTLAYLWAVHTSERRVTLKPVSHIAKVLGYTTRQVHRCVNLLLKKGWILMDVMNTDGVIIRYYRVNFNKINNEVFTI